NHLAGAPGDRADNSRGTGQVGDFAGELALAVDGDSPRFVARKIDDLNLTRRHDEELRVAVADGEQRLPVPVRPGHGGRTTAQSSDLGVVERREGDGQEVEFGHASVSRLWKGW